MMKRITYYSLLALLMAFMASCSSTKRLNKMPMVGGVTGVEYMEKLLTSAPDWNSFQGKTSVELFMGKKGRTRVNATLRIRREEVIQLSVAPVLGIEVARLELTPDGLLVVDRVNKCFVRASFAEVSELLHVDVNFHILQSLFLNELFLPGKKGLDAMDVTSFTLTTTADRAKIQPKSNRRVNYQFYTSATDGTLQQTLIGLRGTPYGLNWNYSDFTPLEGRLFPRKTSVQLQGVNEPYALHLKMSRLSVNGKWSGRTNLSSRYKEIELSALLNALLKL